MLQLFEVGTQGCTLNGFNLQKVLNSFTLLDALINDPSGLYFGAVYTDNEITVENLIKNMKYIPWPLTEVPATLACKLNHRSAIVESGKQLRYFRANVESARSAAKCVVDLMETPRRSIRSRHAAASSPSDADLADITELLFKFDAGFKPILDHAQRILDRPPKTLDDLKVTLGNQLIDEQFLLWRTPGFSASVLRFLEMVRVLRNAMIAKFRVGGGRA
jgi:hypothetical protein